MRAHARMRACACACVRACLRICVPACLRVCMRPGVREPARPCDRASVRPRMGASVPGGRLRASVVSRGHTPSLLLWECRKAADMASQGVGRVHRNIGGGSARKVGVSRRKARKFCTCLARKERSHARELGVSPGVSVFRSSLFLCGNYKRKSCFLLRALGRVSDLMGGPLVKHSFFCIAHPTSLCFL